MSAAGRQTGEGKCRRAWDCGDRGSGLQVMASACGCGKAGELGAGGRGAGELRRARGGGGGAF